MNKLLLVLISALAFSGTPSFATPSSETSMVSAATSVTDHFLMTKKKGKSHKKSKKHKAG
jgi:predicted transcriptional regulator